MARRHQCEARNSASIPEKNLTEKTEHNVVSVLSGNRLSYGKCTSAFNGSVRHLRMCLPMRKGWLLIALFLIVGLYAYLTLSADVTHFSALDRQSSLTRQRAAIRVRVERRD